MLVILTDDQRWDTLWAMPYLREVAELEGAVFTNAFVTNPECCPMRASFMAGGLPSSDTGVLANHPPNGGTELFDDSAALGVLLQRRGYRTAYVGKYFQNYFSASDGLLDRAGLLTGDISASRGQAYVPPGWSTFVSIATQENKREDPWHNFMVSVGASVHDQPAVGSASEHRGTYITTYEVDEILRFLDGVGRRPWFAVLALHAPHLPAIPETPADRNPFQEFTHTSPSIEESDLSDKPFPRLGQTIHGHLEGAPDFQRDQLASLRAVDRGVRRIRERLAENDDLDRTLILYMSDNGMLWGEHELAGKNRPYEESIRVPLVALHPAIVPGERHQLVAADLDGAATVLDVAGSLDVVQPPPTEGSSLLPLLFTEGAPAWRSQLLIQSFSPNPWAALRTLDTRAGKPTTNTVLIAYPGGEIEYYDLVRDPHQLESIPRASAPRIIEEQLAEIEATSGLTIVPRQPDMSIVGQPFRFAVEVWGGTRPYSWTLRSGSLPPGIELDSGQGILQGTPRQPGSWAFEIVVEDSSRRKGSGLPQRFVGNYEIVTRFHRERERNESGDSEG